MSEFIDLVAGTVTYPDPPTLCEGECANCGHAHVHTQGGPCLSGGLPGGADETPCPCPYPHGLHKEQRLGPRK
jgi:hypothetical protein